MALGVDVENVYVNYSMSSATTIIFGRARYTLTFFGYIATQLVILI